MANSRVLSILSGANKNAYGGIPDLPTTQGLSNIVSSTLNNAIPNFNNLTSTASSNIGNQLNGQVPGDVQNQIRDRAATMAVQGGMPGSSNTQGSLFGNLSLRDLGLTSLDQQNQGIGNLLKLLQGYSGTVAPTYGQAQEQENARSTYQAAPDPFAQAQEQERLYNKYSLQGGGGGGAPAPASGHKAYTLGGNVYDLNNDEGNLAYLRALGR